MLSELVSNKEPSFLEHSLSNPETKCFTSAAVPLCQCQRTENTWAAAIPSLPPDLPPLHCVILMKLWGCFIKRSLRYNFQEISIFKFRVCSFFYPFSHLFLFYVRLGIKGLRVLPLSSIPRPNRLLTSPWLILVLRQAHCDSLKENGPHGEWHY